MEAFPAAHLQALLSRVLADAPMVLTVLDLEGVITISEGSQLERMGLKPGELVGCSVFERYQDDPGQIDIFKRAISGESFTATVRSGGMILETRYAPLVDGEGAAVGSVGIGIDISPRVQAELSGKEHLRRERELRLAAENASRSKDEFLALLSHELRTPMTAMLGWTFLLRESDMSSSEFQAALEAIERNMKAQAQIIEDLLDVSKIVTGKVRLETRAVEIDSVVRAALDVVRPAAQARKVKLSFELRDPKAVVYGDPQRLQQAVWNLVSNAVKFSDEGGAVYVAITREEKDSVIRVWDHGGGIHPDYMPHLFDLFTQAESSLTREHGGLGMGLAIVRHIVELHGGKIFAESPGVGMGSKFTVVFPAAEAEEGPLLAEKASPDRKPLFGAFPDLSGIRVLVIDDEADTRKMLKAVLEYAKADVASAASAAEAFELVKNGSFDVLVVDIMMPGEDGYSLLRRIREQGPEQGSQTPAAALTALVGVEDRTAALRSGFQMYLPKPVEPAELVVVVKALASENNRIPLK